MSGDDWLLNIYKSLQTLSFVSFTDRVQLFLNLIDLTLLQVAPSIDEHLLKLKAY